MPTKKATTKKQVKRAVKSAVGKKKKTDAVDSTEKVKVTADQFFATPGKTKPKTSVYKRTPRKKT